MISPAELTVYLETLKAAGVTGPVDIGGIKLTIAPVTGRADAPVAKRNPNKDYDLMLFAATEGLPDEEGA